MHRIAVILLLFLILLPVPVIATIYKESLWLGLNTQDVITNHHKFAYLAHADVRITNDTYPLHKILGSAGLGYILNPNMNAWLGYYNNITNLYHNSYQEHRIWQQFYWKLIKNEHSEVGSRTRLQESTFSNNHHFFYVIRQLIQVTPYNLQHGNFQPWIYDEVFYSLNYHKNLKDEWANQNRFFVGFDYSISKDKYWQIGYINQYIQSSGKNIVNHILSITYVFGNKDIIKPVAE